MNSVQQAKFDELLALPNITTLDEGDAMERIAELIDLSGDLARIDGEEKALGWCDQLEQRPASNAAIATLHYFRANAWGNRRQRKYQGSQAWAWEQPELQREILHLRSAVRHQGFEQLIDIRRCQILTNLANELSTVGRFVEAQEYWSRAILIRPRFAMAVGNRGYGLTEYARALYDPGHQGVFLKLADEALSEALSSSAEYEAATYDAVTEHFSSVRKRIAPYVERGPSIDLDNHDLGSTQEECSYRQWCLKHTLFLNPLNDLGAYAIAAHDILLLPTFSSAIDEPPTLLGFFNQMKQEFVSARWMLYDGRQSANVHFSDRGVALYNTLDYPSYSLAVEKIKAAYRISYSIFDKIAFFLNGYMALGIKPNAVYFRTLWYQNCDASKRQLRAQFTMSENWPLRGLYWLAKDLFDEALRDVTEPDAAALHSIRNHLEHSFLKLHEMMLPPPAPGLWRDDTLTLSVERQDFDRKTLRLLRLARTALMYLSLAMHQEEARRAADPKRPASVAIALGQWEDDWKI